MVITLDFPPSLHKLYCYTARGVYKTKEAKSYQRRAYYGIKNTTEKKFDCIQIHMRVWYPDNRRRDNDNLWKIVMDTLESSGLIDDDRWQICRKETVEAMGVDRENPRIELTIEEYKD